MAWAPGVDGRAADGVAAQGPYGRLSMREMVREYTGELCGPGWRSLRGPSVVLRSTAPSGREWNGSQSGQGATELGQRWGRQGEAAFRAGDSSGEGEEPPPEGLGGHHLLTQTGPRCPTGQTPSPVSPEAALAAKRPDPLDQPHAVLQVSNGVRTSAWRRWSASNSRVSPSRSVMNSCRWRRGPVGNREWASPADKSRTGAASGSLWKGVQWSRPHRRRRPSSMGWASRRLGYGLIRFRRLLCWRMVMEKRTSSLQQTDTTLWV